MYNRILVPLDGSELAECTMDHVKAIATGCHVPDVILLRVIEPEVSVGAGEVAAATKGKLASQVEQELEETHEARAKAYLETKKEQLKRSGVAAKSEVISGKASEQILSYAEKNNIDLIIMSTHGRSGITRWAFGSIADRITRYSRIPVLIVTPRGCRLTDH